MCDSDVYRKVCERIPCDLYHPQVCSANLSHKICKWGAECKFRHLNNDVQGYGHEYNKRRRGSHYDHYDNHLTRSQNNYRYGVDPKDSWCYVRSDGRHQNKRAYHNPKRYKNQNIDNQANNHQNPQISLSNEKYNQNS